MVGHGKSRPSGMARPTCLRIGKLGCAARPRRVPEILTAFQVQEMLGLASRWETEEFLKRAQAHLHYSAEDLAQDLRTLHELGLR
jgi:hypothetical protein